ncbi:hypothetical protein [Embleya sp. AB8]|uniref:hypothetical protein n=1 Tax=Embleya sp. AB8 TaxID=3156304 RepID=UPI003C72604F
MDETTDERLPGVRYRKVTRTRQESVTIDGHTRTRDVPYDAWVPRQPRDWDAVVLRGVTGVAAVVTVLTVTGTTAAIGGLLAPLLVGEIAYSIAVVFDVVMLCCIALEWLERFDRARAWAPRNAGWTCLAISMGAIITFGREHGHLAAGVAGAFLPLLGKVLWALVLRQYAVPLSDGVAYWLTARREEIGARAALSAQLRRLDAQTAHTHAAYGLEAAARTAAITAPPAVLSPAAQLPAPVAVAPAAAPVPTTAVAVAPVPSPVIAPPMPNVPAPVPVAAVPVAPAPVVPATTVPGHPACTPETPIADTTGQPSRTVSAQLSAPLTAPAPTVDGHAANTTDTPAADVSEHVREAPQTSTVQPISALTIAGTIREILRVDLAISDDDLTTRVATIHGHTPRLAETVRRTRDRIVNPKNKKKRRAS